jgi:hypothetical protein
MKRWANELSRHLSKEEVQLIHEEMLKHWPENKCKSKLH